MLVNITFIQHYVVGSCQCTKIRKRNKSYQELEEEKIQYMQTKLFCMYKHPKDYV